MRQVLIFFIIRKKCGFQNKFKALILKKLYFYEKIVHISLNHVRGIDYENKF